MIVQPVLDVTIVNEDSSTIVHTTEENNLVVVQDNESIIVYEQISPVIIETAGTQGPPGPASGPRNDIEQLHFAGQGHGSTKTTTRAYQNVLYEAYAIGDELFMTWTAPAGFDPTKDITFYGTYFAETDGVNRTSSWEIHITTHNGTMDEITGTIYANDLPVADTAFVDNYGGIIIPAATYLTFDTSTIHIRLVRVVSTNDPSGDIGVTDLRLEYGTDGRVGAQGDTGPQGPPGDEEVPYSRYVDFVDDDHAYIGEAVPGSATSSAVWRIKYVTFFADGDVTSLWAGGTSDFDKTWDLRASYTYS